MNTVRLVIEVAWFAVYAAVRLPVLLARDALLWLRVTQMVGWWMMVGW